MQRSVIGAHRITRCFTVGNLTGLWSEPPWGAKPKTPVVHHRGSPNAARNATARGFFSDKDDKRIHEVIPTEHTDSTKLVSSAHLPSLVSRTHIAMISFPHLSALYLLSEPSCLRYLSPSLGCLALSPSLSLLWPRPFQQFWPPLLRLLPCFQRSRHTPPACADLSHSRLARHYARFPPPSDVFSLLRPSPVPLRPLPVPLPSVPAPPPPSPL